MRPFYPANLGQGHFSTASGETRARVVLTCTSGALQHKLQWTLWLRAAANGRLWVTSSIHDH